MSSQWLVRGYVWICAEHGADNVEMFLLFLSRACLWPQTPAQAKVKALDSWPWPHWPLWPLWPHWPLPAHAGHALSTDHAPGAHRPRPLALPPPLPPADAPALPHGRTPRRRTARQSQLPPRGPPSLPQRWRPGAAGRGGGQLWGGGAGAAAGAGGSDRCGEGRKRRRSGGGRSAGTSSGRAKGWGKRRPCPSCAIGNSPWPSPPRRRCPLAAERGPLAGRAAGPWRWVGADGEPPPSPPRGGERGARGRGQRRCLPPVPEERRSPPGRTGSRRLRRSPAEETFCVPPLRRSEVPLPAGARGSARCQRQAAARRPREEAVVEPEREADAERDQNSWAGCDRRGGEGSGGVGHLFLVVAVVVVIVVA